jgi:hypothetical protein
MGIRDWKQISVFELDYDLTWKSAAVTKKRVDGHFFSFGPKFSSHNISITSGFYLTISFTSEDKYGMTEGW